MYDDGSGHCFGCHYYVPPEHVSLGALKRSGEDTEAFSGKEFLPPPNDLDTVFSEEAWKWLQKYDISIEDCLRNNIYYSPSWNQIVFTWSDADGGILGWQARNFNEGKRKYFTQAPVKSLVRVYHDEKSKHFLPPKKSLHALVLVEDVISAVKVSKFCEAMPVLGSGLDLTSLTRLSNMYGTIICWLDSNMFHHSLTMCGQLANLGIIAHPLYTDLDPKEYDLDTIKEHLLRTGMFNENST